MARSGFEKGFAPGRLQGVKTGLGMGNMRCGYVAGRTDGTVNNDKHQDPENLVGAKIPIIHWNAEQCTVNASNNVLTVTNLANQTSPLTLSVASDPNRAGGDVYGTKSALTFDATDYIGSSLINGFGSECTIMLVCSLNTSADLCTYVFSSAQNQPGDIKIVSLNGNQIQSSLTGNGGSATFSVWNTPDNLIPGEWYIVTCKYRMYAVNGPGTEQEVYINGTRQNIIPVTTTFGTGNTTDVFQPIGGAPFVFGGDTGQTKGGNEIATSLVFTYWLNETEQIRMENYLKQYYGYKF